MNKKRINDRYEIEKPIGGGGMADVYLARDIILDRNVAVKVLKPQFSEDEEFIKRFRREAQAATSLSHPNVVNIYDVGEEDKLYYIVMEYIEGYTLKDYIQQKGKLHVHEAVSIMEQITSAIEHAHENHIIHRDIKPHNILIGKDHIAKVTDFGIARAISEATITHTNSVLGSVHYLSPEQARGGHVTYKSDIYSLGIVMYEMLTGEVPFNGDTAVSVAIKHLQNPLPFLRDKDPSIPQSVENVVIKATAKSPLDRYETADEMVENLITVFDAKRNGEKRIHIPLDDADATKAVPIVGNVTLDNQATLVNGQNSGEHPLNTNNNTIDKQPKKKKTAKFWVTLSIAILLFIFGAMYVAFSLIPSLLHVDEVTIPDDLVGMEFEEVYEILSDLELEVEEEYSYNDEWDEGIVIRHDPVAGRSVKVGTVVTVYVSDGIEPTPMVNVIGETRQIAERLLEQYDSVEIEYRESSDYDGDTVLDQTPAPGELVIPNETVVSLIVSERPTYMMANLYGISRDEVIESYANHPLLDLNFEDGEYHPTIEEGTVISQYPPRGTEISERTEVRIVLSLGPEPEEEPEEQPITVNVPFLMDVSDLDISGNNDNNNDDGEQRVRVRISIQDMMYSTPFQVIDREIIGGEVFQIPMTVAPGESGFILAYVGDEEYRDSPYEYSYDDLKQYE
ncbi:Stk1 family PASTA domain-containing Ser/Thr kinase [Evansella sp. AB-P1]|uniref:Stk1 family PASTA domain-containing Ser/Thr kinase n=1 Tax=Evansella sp. AB-P1 TaxID=3037653 RepID=UPI00241CB6D4|nr:Stk1 family PASTA domain-containing Ser/Thr kinase [Evansella sp. AB-P1]MDG5788242.1 Stk1 family PASTA domain-containing Ser/Thr kinase [Evansella sp. AB-P1]